MLLLHSLAVMVFAMAGQPGQPIAAPVPKDKPPPSLEGKYNLVSVSSPERMAGPGGFAPGNGLGGGGVVVGGRMVRTTSTVYMIGPTLITKNEITLEGNGSARAMSLGPTTMEYTIDPTKEPMTIDVETVTDRGKKIKQLGVVDVVGNRVILALAKSGEDRPKTTDESEAVTVYYFQKAPPPPRTEFRIVAMTVGKEEAAEKELNKLAQEGYVLVTTTQPLAADSKSAPTTIHFVLRRKVASGGATVFQDDR